MQFLRRHIFDPVSIAPLAVFRVLFGGIMFISIVRFALKGWIDELYIAPKYYFTFYGFDWVQPLGETGMYLLFFGVGLAALGIMLGAFYRISTVLFFLAFTYIELIDKSNYLNHYYFVSLIAFLLIWVPAHRYFSVDVWRKPQLLSKKVAAGNVNIFKFQIGLVYAYAGIAKLNSEWLLRAMPLKLWLPAKSDLFLIGPLLEYEWVAYAFSWFGAVYDLFIVFFLLYAPTRKWAYGVVISFHMMTALLFQIGMFPYIMTLAALIFFPAAFHQRLIDAFPIKLRVRSETLPGESLSKRYQQGILILLGIYVCIQLILPFRYTLYPGSLFWNEQGYRFSWRVMLMEKAGYTVFNIQDTATGKFEQCANYEYLTPNQEKMMSTQPDMILQFAHFLYKEYQQKGFEDPVITAESYVTLNGRRSQRLVDPKVNLAKIPRGFQHKYWVLPLEKESQKVVRNHEEP